MTRHGYFLPSEEYKPAILIEQAKLAEQVGFEALWISDHFHPWLDAQGQSSFVWSVIGAISQVTSLPINNVARPSREAPGGERGNDAWEIMPDYGSCDATAGDGRISVPGERMPGTARHGAPAARRPHAGDAGAVNYAVTACFWSLLVTWMLRGLAASRTGMVRVRTPAA